MTASRIDIDGWDGEIPKLAELEPAPPEVREAIIEMLGFEANRVQRIVCLADADRWIKQEVNGRAVARITREYPHEIGEITIYIPRISPAVKEFFEEDLDNIASTMLTIKIETGILRYYWQRLCRWAHGR